MDLIRYCNFELLACAILISSLFVIDGISSDNLPPSVDQCSPNPCQNRAICRLRGDGYSCFCVPGFQGAHCQIDVNECVSQPCRNGATCEDRVGRFSCLCTPGFTGVTCEVQIDECQSQPCLNGGRCHDYAGGFTCTCVAGFQGQQCEINIDECQEQPCQNGALCIDGVNDYSCDCSQTGFTGQHCETPSPTPSPCSYDPCFNSAICRDNLENYTCECWPGFEGSRCEIDINECRSSPCMHGGSCIERSWQALYGNEPLLPERYDHRHAAGSICSCPPGTTGSLCQEVISQCDPSPCQNGGRCESRAGGYRCHCLRPSRDGILYGGENCDVKLVGCEGHECQNQGTCSPFLSDGTHVYTCTCSPGFTGPLCHVPTTFSFERKGYLLLQNPLADVEVACNITLSFKTVMPRALLFQRNTRGLLLRLELEGGQLRLTLTKETSAGAEAESPIQVLELLHDVADGQWYSVEAVLGNWLLSLKLLNDAGKCARQSCHKVAPIISTVVGLVSPPQNTFIGGMRQDSSGPNAYTSLPAFIGCMQDVFVDWQLIVPEEWLSDSAVNVSPGCSHRDRCLDVPCQNRGQCVNLWQSYQCQCPRPYEGEDCEEEHVTARFGNEDSHSYAVFAVTDDLSHNFSISLFLRTRRTSGLLLALTNSGSQYLHMLLEEGRVTVRLNSSESLKSDSAIDDGEVHFVSVEVDGGLMTLYVASQKQGDVEVGTVSIQAGDSVYVGGLLEESATSGFGGFFKGCIQDLRIGDRRLQFFGLDTSVKSYPLDLMENVTAGCSGDNACSRNPCQNGGICYSNWDDFTCACPASTVGRRCEEVKWCELSPCPRDAECRMLNQGYECYTNATFLNENTVMSYRGNGFISRNLTNISLNLRTRKRNAAILHAEKGSAFITVSVQDGLLFMELQSTPTDHSEVGGEDGRVRSVSTVSLSSRRTVSDGEWHNVHLFMAAPWAQTSRWTLVLDEEVEEATTSRSQGGNLDFLRQEVDIFLGGLAPDAGWSLAGCLGTVELGGIALPYFTSSDVNLPRLQEETFVRMSLHPPLVGCSGASVCEPNPCLNGGECQDLFNTYNCSCTEGWAGRHCNFFRDTCASNPCVHGNCSINGLTYECACDFGYAGVDCEEEVDVCENHLCAHGGTCLHGPDRYACLCAENYTGPLCNERVEEIPWYIVVKNVRPKLPVSVCGDDNRNYTCFNGGNCTERELSCDCPPGFIGHRCEQEVDECKSNPCLNGGYCRNLINKFVCVCDMSFAGDVCQTDLTSGGLTSDLLLSISLASVMLLLVLILISVGLVVALNRRATHGTYSPSRQEKDGSRVEMWSITQPPPMERLI
ncbi:protein crumbs homolog 1 isoform X2 [Salarias fasciatus]|uniref:protein crumbs homolog 1 isoform X2 n=1 Tax=Salarias fasciatus TaxID=181472 RepID=UPI001176B489|nr:protein crumbs homolog 1 isoform X2 [Salarias fasciatus]